MAKYLESLEKENLVNRIYFAGGVLIALMIAGSVGYHLIEGMTLFNGFYMTFITITTIGFGEIRVLSWGGRLLTMAISVVGIGTLAYIASQTTQFLFESHIFRHRAIKKALRKMEDHYIVCGFGRIGRRIAKVLHDEGIPIVVIENKKPVVESTEEEGYLVVEGNAQEEETMIRAGIKRAKGLVCTLSNDQDNVFVTLLARDLNEELFIMVRTNQQRNMKKMIRAGANKVISPYEIGADRMVNVILRPHVNLFLEKMFEGSTEDHFFDEMIVSESSDLIGKTMAESGIRQAYSVLIIAVIPAGSTDIKFNPGSDYVLNLGDTLIALGDIGQMDRFRIEACKDGQPLADRKLG